MQLPFTLQLAFHSFRAVVRAGLILLLAWMFLIPANVTEIEALGARDGESYPFGLRAMRAAQIVVKAAPPQIYDLIAMAVGPEVSPWMVEIAVAQMAAGKVLPASAQQTPVSTINSDRDIDGPRFIQLD